jgi:hypothetical protein
MNCKPGDLARIVSNGYRAETPQIIDRICEVVRPAVVGEIFTALDGRQMRSVVSLGPAWVIRSANPLPWKSRTGPHAGDVMFFEMRPMSDQFLRRIGGVPVHDEQHDEVPA